MNVALCAIAKMENLYIREWVMHYKQIGISKIFLYDNNVVNGEVFDEVISDFIQEGFVKVIDYRGNEKCQCIAYNECYNTYGKEFDWMCFFDIDEFMMIPECNNISQHLDKPVFDNAHLILVNWITYGDNNRIYMTDGLVCERFPLAAPADAVDIYGEKINTHVKSIIRCHLPENIIITWQDQDCTNPHAPIIKDVSNTIVVNGNGDRLYEIKNKGMYRYDTHSYDMYLKHYSTKSLQEYIERKIVRGYPTLGHDVMNTPTFLLNAMFNYFTINQCTTIKIKAFEYYMEKLFNIQPKLLYIDNDNIKVSLAAIVKNENTYIREWVEYYFNLGVDTIYLCDNNEKDGEYLTDVINDYIDSGKVVVLDYRGVHTDWYPSVQVKAYNDCYALYKNTCDWMMFFDIDEFLYLEHGCNIKQMLSLNIFKNYQMIHVNWKVYGDNGHVDRDKWSIYNTYTVPDNGNPCNTVKSIIRTNSSALFMWDKSNNPHTPVCYNANICDFDGNSKIANEPENPYVCKNGHLRHLYTKSTCEFFSCKCARGYADGAVNSRTPQQEIETYFSINSFTFEKWKFIKNFYKNNGIDIKELYDE